MEKVHGLSRLAVNVVSRGKTFLAMIGAFVIAYAAVTSIMSGIGKPLETPVSAQNGDAYLSRRIDQVENRFYGIESRLTRLESQTRPMTPSSPTLSPSILADASEVQFLRTQIDSLRLRLGEAECALLKLDERTLTPAALATRKKAASVGTDKCREERDVPIHLSARP